MLLLPVVLLMVLLSVPASAAFPDIATFQIVGSFDVGGFSYTILSDGTASITGCALTGDIMIPETIDSYTVSNLASELFFYRSGITSVTIPATVTYFGENPNDSYWDYVFSYCWDLQNIYVASGNPTFCDIDGVLYARDGFLPTLINYPCSHPGQTYHVISDTLCCTSFAGCQNLKFLFLDNPDTTWYTYTFNYTNDLTTFFVSGGNTEAKVASESQAGRNGMEYFCKFVNRAEIQKLPWNLASVPEAVFQNTAVKYLIVPDTCKRIEAGAFTGSSLELIRVKEGTVIDSGALDDAVVVEWFETTYEPGY